VVVPKKIGYTNSPPSGWQIAKSKPELLISSINCGFPTDILLKPGISWLVPFSLKQL